MIEILIGLILVSLLIYLNQFAQKKIDSNHRENNNKYKQYSLEE